MNLVRAILLSSSLASAAAVPAFATLDPELHQLCVDARDDAGCLQMHQQGTETPTKLSLNACPAGHAYSGAGNCTRVICDSPRGGVLTRMVLSSDDHDPACPNVPVQVGWQNACLMASGEIKPTALGAN